MTDCSGTPEPANLPMCRRSLMAAAIPLRRTQACLPRAHASTCRDPYPPFKPRPPRTRHIARFVPVTNRKPYSYRPLVKTPSTVTSGNLPADWDISATFGTAAIRRRIPVFSQSPGAEPRWHRRPGDHPIRPHFGNKSWLWRPARCRGHRQGARPP